MTKIISKWWRTPRFSKHEAKTGLERNCATAWRTKLLSPVKKTPHQKAIWQMPSAEYGGLLGGIAELLETARRTAARTINALMTATYWEIGRRIVEFEHLESFLLELGENFAFIGRERRLRIGGEWYRVDLLFFHRKLRCLVVIDLKVGKFTHADAGQMHLYLNYAREHWTQPSENPPVGLILCAEKDDAIARYALEGLPNKVLAREYRLALPDEKRLAAEIEKTRERLERKVRN